MVDNIPGPPWACALNKTLDASLYSYLVLKVHIPSVMKQLDSKCLRKTLQPHKLQLRYDGPCSFECVASSRGKFNSTHY